MDYETAHHLLVTQGMAIGNNADALLPRLKLGHPPIPGQVTSILLALKVVFEALRDVSELDRELAAALYLLSSESRQQFELGRINGVAWPPLLDEDLDRIAAAVKSIFIGTWQG